MNSNPHQTSETLTAGAGLEDSARERIGENKEAVARVDFGTGKKSIQIAENVSDLANMDPL